MGGEESPVNTNSNGRKRGRKQNEKWNLIGIGKGSREGKLVAGENRLKNRLIRNRADPIQVSGLLNCFFKS